MFFHRRRRRGLRGIGGPWKGAVKGVSGLFIFLAVAVAVISAFTVTVGRNPVSNILSLPSYGHHHHRLLVEEEEASIGQPGAVEEGKDEEGYHGGEEGEEEEYEEAVSPTNMRVMCSIVLVLILLTVGFEVMKERVEESVPEDFAVILEKFFGELTILGFLSMVTFIVSQAGVMTTLSEKIYGEEEGEELLEYFE